MTSEELAEIEKLTSFAQRDFAPLLVEAMREKINELDRCKRLLESRKKLVNDLEPAAYSACLTPAAECQCGGCAYAREWKASK